MLSNISLTSSADWFLDTDAIQHVTPDLANLTEFESYIGNDYLLVGDGKGLPISNIGHTKIYAPHRTFNLSNVLHVPHIKKPLLSVCCYLIFDPYFDKKILKNNKKNKGLHVVIT